MVFDVVVVRRSVVAVFDVVDVRRSVVTAVDSPVCSPLVADRRDGSVATTGDAIVVLPV